MLTQQELMTILNYDPNTGLFRWKYQIGNGKRIPNAIAGSKKKDGYIYIGVNGKVYKAHRLAWLYVTGSWPSNTIDHINGIKDDNRFNNLRDIEHRFNVQNISVPKNNTTGYTGVSWHKASQKWLAKIRINHKAIHLGIFDNINDAIAARKTAEQQYHPYKER
jgi:hypothetical protein